MFGSEFSELSLLAMAGGAVMALALLWFRYRVHLSVVAGAIAVLMMVLWGNGTHSSLIYMILVLAALSVFFAFVLQTSHPRESHIFILPGGVYVGLMALLYVVNR